MTNKKPFDEEYFERRTKSSYGGYSENKFCGFFDSVAEALVDYHPRRALDVGCAKGFLVSALRRRGVEAYGVDISEYAILNAPSDVRKHLHILDVTKKPLPFPDEYFDVISVIETVEHFPSFDLFLRELHRVLASHGVIYLTTPKPGKTIDITHINVHDNYYWRSLFSAYGFSVSKAPKLFLKSRRKILKLLPFSDFIRRLVYFLFTKEWTQVFILRKISANNSIR